MSEVTNGECLLHYEIVRKIGAGGMGNVYLAIDHRLERQVAIKLLHGKNAHEHSLIENEARLLAKLSHANIVQVYDIFETDDGQLAFVMEYIEGCNLQQRANENLLTLKERLDILSQIAEGLSHAHLKGIVHLDLKAENILITHDNQVKITDFGIAMAENDLEHQAVNKGSSLSISPEQALGKPLDYRSDLFSLGVLAFRFLSGEHPFKQRQNAKAMMEEVVSGKPKKLCEIAPHLPLELCKTIDRLLEKNPAARPQDTKELSAFFSHVKLTVTEELEDLTKTFILDTFHTKRKHPLLIHWNRLGRFKYALVFAFLINIGFAAHLAYNHYESNNIEYVVVLPPIIDEDSSMDQEQLDLVDLIVEQTLQSNIDAMENTRLIDEHETQYVLDSGLKRNQEIMSVLGATHLLKPSMMCNKSRCELTVAKYSKGIKGADKTVNRIINASEFSHAKGAAQEAIKLLYPGKSNSSNQTISGDDYLAYIDILSTYSDSARGAKNTETRLLELLERNERYLPLYYLLEQTYLDQYYYTSSQEPLEKLRNLIERAKNLKLDMSQFELIQIEYYIINGEFQEAIDYVNQSQQLSLDQEKRFSQLGYIYFYKKDFDQAIKYYEKALAMRPNRKHRYNIALSYFFDGDLDKSLEYLHQITDVNPYDLPALDMESSIALFQANTKEAIDANTKIVEQYPKRAVAWNSIGLAYLLENKLDKALHYFTKALEIASEHQTEMFHLNIGETYQLMGDHENARRHFEILEAIENPSPHHILAKAAALSHLHKHEEALKVIEEARKVATDKIQFSYTASMVYQIAGETRSANLYKEKTIKAGLSEKWFQFPWFTDQGN